MLNMLLTDKHKELCKVSSLFVMETRKEDDKEYTHKSIYLMTAGLQHVMRQHKGRSLLFNIFSDSRFELFHNVCDYKFHTLHQQGIGTKSKHANALTDEDEASFGNAMY
uniref:QRICH1-like domain-containing protein n=1 Tax=Amphimedon queenslandica TaxID=400682 RepID=A0A1X7UJQ5_AMPQE